MLKSLKSFPCNQCGLCCRNVGMSEVTAYLDAGNGVCRHFDDTTHLCTIYHVRPLICRVEDYYHANLSHQITWADFVVINEEICKNLQEHGVPWVK